MTKKCSFCGGALGDAHFQMGPAVKTIHGLYAHTGCIDSHGKDNTMNEKAQRILGAADSAHQGVGLAVSLLQESLGNMGEILTRGADTLSESSLSRVMHLGQKIKESFFLLEDLGVLAHGLCGLLGRDLGICEDEPKTLADMTGGSLGTPDHRDLLGTLGSDDFAPREDEFDDDEQPF